MTFKLTAPCGMVVAEYEAPGNVKELAAKLREHKCRCVPCAEAEERGPSYVYAPYVPIYHDRPEVYDEFMGLPPRPPWGFRRLIWSIRRWYVRRRINKVLRRKYFGKIKLS